MYYKVAAAVLLPALWKLMRMVSFELNLRISFK
jgi:hypothetical protein